LRAGASFSSHPHHLCRKGEKKEGRKADRPEGRKERQAGRKGDRQGRKDGRGKRGREEEEEGRKEGREGGRGVYNKHEGRRMIRGTPVRECNDNNKYT
jgi:hypothetical protein